MTLKDVSKSNRIIPNLAWSGYDLAQQIESPDQIYLQYINFAAAAESSTQNAFSSLNKVIPKAHQDAVREGNHALANFLEVFHQWLSQWVLEEANHVVFFSSAEAQIQNKLYMQRLPAFETQSDYRGSSSESSGEIFGVEIPIPDNQPWQTTLLFLLYSEIASMIWYRFWYHRLETSGLRNALRHLQNDEGDHYQMFLDFSRKLAQINPQFVLEARRIFLLYAINFRRLLSKSHTRTNKESEKKEQVNWWEHPIFAHIENVERVIKKIISTQKFALSCIQKAVL